MPGETEQVDVEEVKLAARHKLWRRGSLTHKLHASQKKLYAALQGKHQYFLLCSRRLGKSYMLTCLAFEYALKHPQSRISYAAPTQKDATEIVTDLAGEILQDCPDDARPHFDKASKEYQFPNGSIVRFSGVNNEHHENLRGRRAHLFICDEVAQWDDLNYIIDSIISPMTISTDGVVIMASTPPRSPGHDMTARAKQMQAAGELSVMTILDAVHLTYKQKFKALEKAGEDPERIPLILDGTAEPLTTTALREYFCRLDVTDAETAVIPEFTAQAQKEIVFDHPRPQYFDSYTSVDAGTVDNTGLLFAYYDFHLKKIVIEDEALMKRPGTDDVANMVKEKEEALWGAKVPLLRIWDGPLMQVTDFIQRHALVFIPANRSDSQGGIDYLRALIRRREIIISPNCTTLIRQIKNATWNRKATDFERTQEDAHFDLLAALKYLARSIVKNRNPFPAWYGMNGFGYFSSGSSTSKPKTVFTDTPLGRKLAKKNR